MATKNNSQNPYKFDTFEQKQFVYSQLFATGSNTGASIVEKLNLLNVICYLQQKMNKKNPEKYPDCLHLLQVIFGREFDQSADRTSGEDSLLTGLAIICDDLLWGTTDEIQTPEGVTNLKDAKNIIIKYITDEWLPF